jgi:hypothetical protein
MREKENARLAQGSFIHRLIEEALLQFTSLQGDDTPSSDLVGTAGAPLNADLFVDPLRSAPSAAPPGAASRPGDGPEQGNLAALEDDGDEGGDDGEGEGVMRSGGARRPATARAPDDVRVQRAPGDPASDLARAPHRGRLVALGLAVLVALAAALAWFTGLLPHR